MFDRIECAALALEEKIMFTGCDNNSVAVIIGNEYIWSHMPFELERLNKNSYTSDIAANVKGFAAYVNGELIETRC